ncbi:unnamed protein product [Phytomonas sp. Hart1]|nr:unnamed protein product [Phytomonas sp. Hart1]|eukprot:CCW71020.1 unnamed protein product [Phytomonas sp. isolate Hart1]
MNTLAEIYLNTFPKKLRFDRASQILYAQCYLVLKQYKNKKYIPKSEIQDILDQYAPLPGAPWSQLPFVRHILCIRIINVLRVFMGRKSWLYNRNVDEEYTKIKNWLDKEDKIRLGKEKLSPNIRGSRAIMNPGNFIERERFDRELLSTISVATMYQRMARLGMVCALFLMGLLFAAVLTDYFIYLMVRFWWRMDRAGTLLWLREVMERHVATEVPPAYKDLLPPPCERIVNRDQEAIYTVNIVELTSDERSITVMAVPCPLVGEKEFFQEVGRLAASCDCVVAEGVSFDKVDKLQPAMLFPLRTNTFPSFGVHHRFLDILRPTAGDEPPLLYPAGSTIGWNAFLKQVFIPFEVRAVIHPTMLFATKAEARIGWGRLRAVIEEVAPLSAKTKGSTASGGQNKGRPPHYVICIPWTVNQIMNLEASLIKMGFKVKRVFPLHWIPEDYMGNCFCDYYRFYA